MTGDKVLSPEAIQAALDLVNSDVMLNDRVYTPPGGLDRYIDRGDGSEGSGDREPRRPIIPSAAGAVALEESVELAESGDGGGTAVITEVSTPEPKDGSWLRIDLPTAKTLVRAARTQRPR